MSRESRNAWLRNRYHKAKTDGMCVDCFHERAEPDSVFCFGCREKRRHRYPEERAEYHSYKVHKICINCHNEDAEPGHVYCFECLEKKRIAGQKKMLNAEQRAKKSEQDKRRRAERKAAGICTICGRKKAQKPYVLCLECHVKERKAWERNHATTTRSERPDYGECYFCGKPIKEGFRICPKCYERQLGIARVMRGASDHDAHPWRGLNKLLYVSNKTKEGMNE